MSSVFQKILNATIEQFNFGPNKHFVFINHLSTTQSMTTETAEPDNDFAHCKYERQVLFITMNNKLPTDDEWASAKTLIQKYYALNIEQNTVFSIICNLHNVPLLPLHRTRDLSQFLNDNRSQTKQCVLCTCIITNSIIIQSSMKLFFALCTPVRPIHFVNTVDVAHQCIQAHYDNATPDS
jgi:hypothetical protein